MSKVVLIAVILTLSQFCASSDVRESEDKEVRPEPEDTLLVPSLVVTALRSGVRVNLRPGAKLSRVYFKVTVTCSDVPLSIITQGGSGDADLYVKFANIPTPTHYDERSWKYGNREFITVPKPREGSYYILLHAYRAYSGASIQATFS